MTGMRHCSSSVAPLDYRGLTSLSRVENLRTCWSGLVEACPLARAYESYVNPVDPLFGFLQRVSWMLAILASERR